MPAKCADYLEYALYAHVQREIVDRCVEAIHQKINQRFEAIAFRGLSGALIAPAVAYKLGKPLLPVRKGEDTHSSHYTEWGSDHRSFIILDDFISGGGTIRAILDSLEVDGAECRGIVLWNSDGEHQRRPQHHGDIDYDDQPDKNTFWVDREHSIPIIPILARSETWQEKIHRR
jgi:adenine/guanine phosphoribosyltransferase-like PRPP-binding protein